MYGETKMSFSALGCPKVDYIHVVPAGEGRFSIARKLSQVSINVCTTYKHCIF